MPLIGSKPLNGSSRITSSGSWTSVEIIWTFLLITLGEFLYLTFLVFPGEIEKFEILCHYLFHPWFGTSFEESEEQYLVLDAHVVVQSAFLGHVTYMTRSSERDILVEYADAA